MGYETQSGYHVPFRYGVSASGFAWFFDPEEGVFVYDVERQTLKARLRVPAATQVVPGIDKPEPDCSHRNHEMLVGPDGRHLYHLNSHGITTSDLSVINIENGEIVRSFKDLPGGGELSEFACSIALDQFSRLALEGCNVAGVTVPMSMPVSKIKVAGNGIACLPSKKLIPVAHPSSNLAAISCVRTVASVRLRHAQGAGM
ncbi:hypothetical protein ACFQ14_10225 [Pseudahrensia aquimaris]|uniref:Uncharacterized protein n=1 Tax=Pseudahrensia aquimaris TaxID=744461 RepID=A0ABW3FGB9_9HYPH